VKHIVEAHDGRVLVASGIGQGSRFTIELPTTGKAC
jgi:signal transduction histidine kinase